MTSRILWRGDRLVSKSGADTDSERAACYIQAFLWCWIPLVEIRTIVYHYWRADVRVVFLQSIDQSLSALSDDWYPPLIEYASEERKSEYASEERKSGVPADLDVGRYNLGAFVSSSGLDRWKIRRLTVDMQEHSCFLFRSSSASSLRDAMVDKPGVWWEDPIVLTTITEAKTVSSKTKLDTCPIVLDRSSITSLKDLDTSRIPAPPGHLSHRQFEVHAHPEPHGRYVIKLHSWVMNLPGSMKRNSTIATTSSRPMSMHLEWIGERTLHIEPIEMCAFRTTPKN